MKLRKLKWQNSNLEDLNEKWWNLEGEFCIFSNKLIIVNVKLKDNGQSIKTKQLKCNIGRKIGGKKKVKMHI